MSKFLTILFSVVLLALGATQARATNVAEFYANDAAIESLFEQAEVVEFTQVEGKMTEVLSVLGKQAGALDVLAPKDTEQIVAMLLAIIPILGHLAIHRVYLGSTPLMVLYYLITCGGIFGILPACDFIFFVANGTADYQDSNKFFGFSQ